MGRKVESGIDAKGYKRYLDGDFRLDSLFTNPKNLYINRQCPVKNRIDLGSYAAIASISIFRISFKQRIESD